MAVRLDRTVDVVHGLGPRCRGGIVFGRGRTFARLVLFSWELLGRWRRICGGRGAHHGGRGRVPAGGSCNVQVTCGPVQKPLAPRCCRDFDAGSLAVGAGDSHVKMVIVRQRPVRLDHELRGARSYREGCPGALCVREQACPDRGRDEEVGDPGVGVGYERRDERPVACVVEVRAWPRGCRAVTSKRHEVIGVERAARLATNVEADVCVATAFVRDVSIDVAAAWLREMPDRHDRVGELPGHRARRVVDDRHERTETPAHVAGLVRGDDPKVRRRIEMRAADEMPVRGRAYASTGREACDRTNATGANVRRGCGACITPRHRREGEDESKDGSRCHPAKQAEASRPGQVRGNLERRAAREGLLLLFPQALEELRVMEGGAHEFVERLETERTPRERLVIELDQREAEDLVPEEQRRHDERTRARAL